MGQGSVEAAGGELVWCHRDVGPPLDLSDVTHPISEVTLCLGEKVERDKSKKLIFALRRKSVIPERGGGREGRREDRGD